jgi:hypothetical protein
MTGRFRRIAQDADATGQLERLEHSSQHVSTIILVSSHRPALLCQTIEERRFGLNGVNPRAYLDKTSAESPK